MTKDEALDLALEAMGLIGADLVCEAAHHEKADRHGIGEPCPIQARWHHAFTALREALAEHPAQQDSTCSNALRIQHKPYPRTCKKCGLGPCVELAQQALDKKADNARELGLDYEPVQDGGIVTAGGFDPRTQHTWVGLTDEDELDWDGGDLKSLVKAIEAKLKEKNT